MRCFTPRIGINFQQLSFQMQCISYQKNAGTLYDPHSGLEKIDESCGAVVFDDTLAFVNLVYRSALTMINLFPVMHFSNVPNISNELGSKWPLLRNNYVSIFLDLSSVFAGSLGTRHLPWTHCRPFVAITALITQCHKGDPQQGALPVPDNQGGKTRQMEWICQHNMYCSIKRGGAN